jgi:hypothetical protein
MPRGRGCRALKLKWGIVERRIVINAVAARSFRVRLGFAAGSAEPSRGRNLQTTSSRAHRCAQG